MKRCVIYGRVSLEEQMQQFGLPAQLRACREYAERSGYEVIEECSDEGISGAEIDRPALNRVRELVRQRAVDAVVMLDADRLSRELAHLLILKPEIERNARLEFVAAKFEDSASGRMFFGIRGVIAQYERELVKERTMRGRKEKARQGYIVGGRVPYGYSYVGKSKGERGRYVINEDQAAAVRQIFRWADEGVSIRGIVRHLNESGIPPQRSTRWAKSSVARILGSELYAGTAHYNCRRREKAVLRMRPEAEWISLSVPAIVDRKLWERVSDKLSENRRNTVGRPTNRYLLRGLLFCSCGKRMRGDPGHGSPNYRCSGRPKCQCRVLTRKIDDAAWRAVSECFIDARKLRALIQRHIEALTSDTSAEKAKRLRAQIEKLQAKEFRATRALIDPELIDHYDTLKAQLREVRSQRKGLERELDAIESALSFGPKSLSVVDRIVQSIRGVLPKLTTEQRQEFFRRFVEKIVFSDGYLTITAFFVAQYWPERADVVDHFEQPEALPRRISFVIRRKVA